MPAARHTRRFTSSPLPLARSHMPSPPAVEKAPSWLSQGAGTSNAQADHTLYFRRQRYAAFRRGHHSMRQSQWCAGDCRSRSSSYVLHHHEARRQNGARTCARFASQLLAGQHSCRPVPPSCHTHQHAMTSSAPSSLFLEPTVQACSVCQSQAHFLLARRSLGTPAATTTPHGQMAENSTLDSLTGESQNFMPLGGRCIADCGWPRNSLLQGYVIAPIVRPVTSRLPSRHLLHVPRPRCQELATTERHVPAQPPETTPRHLVSSGLTPSTYLDFLSYACLSFKPFLSLGSSLVYKIISRIQGVALLFPSWYVPERI
ncbi:hypothetical protein F5148DRAFT_623497 [Russula earlei]|uniref:Uncharacterized protein n=1 Tax=Russula earlei TaxID=71964 RepID=A0ACC0UF44_9AGAM|nr:hypothetical protein F5148DRAFT_623497 [Russula earlei]